MSSVVPKYAEAELIADLQLLHHDYPGGISRNFYRENGAFTEKQWQKYFSKFSDFLEAAGLSTAPPSTQPNEIDETVGNQRTIHFDKTRIQTLEELLEHCRIDLQTWKVDRFTVNKWESAAIDGPTGTKRAIITPLFQVKAQLTRRVEMVAVREEIAELKRQAKDAARVPKRITRPVHNTGNILEINIPDLHAAKSAWSRETGYQDYNTEIALATFRRALDTLLSRTAHFRFDLVLLVTGNDLLHADDLAGRTTSGTPVMPEGSYHRTFVAVRDAMIEAVERLRQVAPVKVISCPGNHDTLSAWHLNDSLECYFHRYEDVEVDNSPRARKYHRHGNVLLMFTHGNTGKRADYPLLMAAEEPTLWGATKFREAHTGHLHQTRTDEQHGVRIRILPALCPPDAWHASNAYTNNLRVAEAYVWNDQEGLVTQAFHNEDALSCAA